MKQTAVEWVLDCLIEKHSNGSFVWNTRADLEALFEQAKEMEKQKMIEMHDKGFDSVVQLNDDYAIGFAEWCIKWRVKFVDDTIVEILYNYGGMYQTYTIQKLLEIYKKEKHKNQLQG